MRNLGYMKGERAIDCINSSANSRSTTNRHIIRHIIIRQTLDPDKTYYIKFKTVLDRTTAEFYMDGLEYCPKEISLFWIMLTVIFLIRNIADKRRNF